MPKKVNCGDVMPGCTKVIEGDDDKDVLAKTAEHAKADHNVTAINPELASKIRSVIRES